MKIYSVFLLDISCFFFMIFLLELPILNILVLQFQVFEINESLYVVELKKSSGDCSLYRKVLLPPLMIQNLKGLVLFLVISFLANI